MQDPICVSKIGEVRVLLYLGDITKVNAMAIANAANSSLLGGGGVDGAIHHAAGKKLDEECFKLHKQGGCPTGEARITSGGNLFAEYVIHTVGPVWKGGAKGEAALLAGCYTSSILLAKKHDITSLIFPSISTGVYGYPIEKAAAVSKEAVQNALLTPGSLKETGWCLFDEKTFAIYEKIWQNKIK